MRKVALSFIVFAVFLSGCAYTEITSYKDPDFSDVSYSNMAIVVKTDNMKNMLIGEQSFEEVFRQNGVLLKMGNKVFKPTEEYTEEQRLQILKNMNIDGVLEVTFKSQNEKTNVHFSEHHASSSTTVFLMYTVDLIDLESGKKAWTASTETRGEDLPFDVMMDSLADAVFRDLKLKALIN